jgi:hypothetical protein
MSRTLLRRTFLRGSGVAMALPLLDAMLPVSVARGAAAALPPRRMVAVCSNLGFHTPFLFPEQAGSNYEAPPYLKVLEPLRNDFTVFSGVSHPAVDGGHSAEMSFLTAAPHPGSPGFKNTISLDQLMAERIGAETRYSHLTLSTNGGNGLSWTRGGVRIPSDGKPSKVFERLFLPGGGNATQRLRNGESIMDLVGEQARQMQREVGPNDRQKLDEYFTSVRELEQRLVRGQEWVRKPKPKVDVPPPQDITDNADMIGQIRLMFDLMHLALKTDSTRIITLFISGVGGVVPKIAGVSDDWHNLSHHGQDPTKIEHLKLIELVKFEGFRDFLLKLKATQEQDETLLDRTMVLFGSHLGNASSHNTRNLPLVLAGGGFRHGQHLAFDRQNNAPVSNIYVSMLQQMGLEFDSFGSSSGTLNGLENR